MKRLAVILLLVAVAGCAPQGGRHDEDPPAPPPAPPGPTSPLADAAAQSFDEFRSAWALEADATAAAAARYRSWDEAFGDWEKRNQAARENAFARCVDALHAATGGDEERYNAEALAAAAREVARGARRD